MPEHHPQTATGETEGSHPYRRAGRSGVRGSMCWLQSHLCRPDKQMPGNVNERAPESCGIGRLCKLGTG